MVGILPIERQQPVRLPSLAGEPEPDEILFVQQLLRQFVFQRRRRKGGGVADIDPDVAAPVFGRVGGHRDFVTQPAVLRLPRDQRAAAVPVEPQTVEQALQLAVEHPADREFRVAVRAAAVDGADISVPVPPERQLPAQYRHAERFVAAELFRLRDRIPVVFQPFLQALRDVGHDLSNRGTAHA